MHHTLEICSNDTFIDVNSNLFRSFIAHKLHRSKIEHTQVAAFIIIFYSTIKYNMKTSTIFLLAITTIPFVNAGTNKTLAPTPGVRRPTSFPTEDTLFPSSLPGPPEPTVKPTLVPTEDTLFPTFLQGPSEPTFKPTFAMSYEYIMAEYNAYSDYKGNSESSSGYSYGESHRGSSSKSGKSSSSKSGKGSGSKSSSSADGYGYGYNSHDYRSSSSSKSGKSSSKSGKSSGKSGKSSSSKSSKSSDKSRRGRSSWKSYDGDHKGYYHRDLDQADQYVRRGLRHVTL